MAWLGGGTPEFLDRIIKWFGLEGTLKIILLQPPCHGQGLLHYPRLLQALSKLSLDISRDGAASLDNLCQGPMGI